jgi:hypothetical protein
VLRAYAVDITWMFRRRSVAPIPRFDYRADVDTSELLQTITLAHEELSELVGRISDERLLDAATDDWTGKDVLAHLAWWREHSARLIENVSAEREPEDTPHSGSRHG